VVAGGCDHQIVGDYYLELLSMGCEVGFKHDEPGDPEVEGGFQALEEKVRPSPGTSKTSVPGWWRRLWR
jgi:hypothetical protein